jgi:anti-sigma factor ChrR (cupin superfamily)
MIQDTMHNAPVAPTGRAIHVLENEAWQPMMIENERLPGFWFIPIVDDSSGQWTSYWMRLEPGAESLVHTHTSTELLLILDGIYTDQDGTDFTARQVVTYPAGSTHRSYSRDGCTVLVVTNTESTL